MHDPVSLSLYFRFALADTGIRNMVTELRSALNKEKLAKCGAKLKRKRIGESMKVEKQAKKPQELGPKPTCRVPLGVPEDLQPKAAPIAGRRRQLSTSDKAKWNRCPAGGFVHALKWGHKRTCAKISKEEETIDVPALAPEFNDLRMGLNAEYFANIASGGNALNAKGEQLTISDSTYAMYRAAAPEKKSAWATILNKGQEAYEPTKYTALSDDCTKRVMTADVRHNYANGGTKIPLVPRDIGNIMAAEVITRLNFRKSGNTVTFGWYKPTAYSLWQQSVTSAFADATDEDSYFPTKARAAPHGFPTTLWPQFPAPPSYCSGGSVGKGPYGVRPRRHMYETDCSRNGSPWDKNIAMRNRARLTNTCFGGWCYNPTLQATAAIIGYTPHDAGCGEDQKKPWNARRRLATGGYKGFWNGAKGNPGYYAGYDDYRKGKWISHNPKTNPGGRYLRSAQGWDENGQRRPNGFAGAAPGSSAQGTMAYLTDAIFNEGLDFLVESENEFVMRQRMPQEVTYKGESVKVMGTDMIDTFFCYKDNKACLTRMDEMYSINWFQGFYSKYNAANYFSPMDMSIRITSQPRGCGGHPFCSTILKYGGMPNVEARIKSAKKRKDKKQQEEAEAHLKLMKAELRNWPIMVPARNIDYVRQRADGMSKEDEEAKYLQYGPPKYCMSRVKWSMCLCKGCKCNTLVSVSMDHTMEDVSEAYVAKDCSKWFTRADQAVRSYLASVRGSLVADKTACCSKWTLGGQTEKPLLETYDKACKASTAGKMFTYNEGNRRRRGGSIWGVRARVMGAPSYRDTSIRFCSKDLCENDQFATAKDKDGNLIPQPKCPRTAGQEEALTVAKKVAKDQQKIDLKNLPWK